jgi:hypothetical protein
MLTTHPIPPSIAEVKERVELYLYSEPSQPAIVELYYIKMSYQLDTPAVLTPRIRYPVKYLV